MINKRSVTDEESIDFSYSNYCEGCQQHFLFRSPVYKVCSYSSPKKSYMCSACVDKYAFKCPNCNKYIFNEDKHEDHVVTNIEKNMDEEWCEEWCEECFDSGTFTCYGCDKHYSLESEHYVSTSDEYICEKCVEDGEYSPCSNCGRADSTYVMNTVEDSYDSMLYCDTCYEEEYGNVLEGAGFNVLECELEIPEEILKGTKKPYMGLEIEIETFFGNKGPSMKEIMAWVRNDRKIGVCKHESAVGNNGFELVTIPLLMNEHAERWLYDFFEEDFFSEFHSRGENCGIHIHLNRDSLSYAGLGRLIFLIYARINAGFAEIIGERDQGNYSWRAEPMNSLRAKLKSIGKFEAINLAHSHTIEFRMFDSILKIDSILKDMEFVAACQKFCNEEIFIIPTYQNFVKFVSENKSEYPNLDAFLTKKISDIKPRRHANSKRSGIFKSSSMKTLYYHKSAKDDVFVIDENGNSCIIYNNGTVQNLSDSEVNLNSGSFLPITVLAKE